MAIALGLLSGTAMSQPIAIQPYAIPPMDAPSLAALGVDKIGTMRGEIISPDTVTLTNKGVTRAPRIIKYRIWYPAQTPSEAVKAQFTHILPKPNGQGAPFTIPSIAFDNALVTDGDRHPLVIVSHGYNGWDSFMTWLTENLATKGYIVVAIDHGDQRAVTGPELALSFGNVLINRAADQRAVINHFTARAADRKDPLGKRIDTHRIGLIGYSMGSFGVLATAGMDYDADSAVFKQLPAEAKAAIFESQEKGKALTARVKAVVALAPFGGRPESRVWAVDTVANFAKPTLVIGGSDDDIVDAKHGISWIFETMASNKRHFLSFLNARHNVGGNPAPPEAYDDFSTQEYFAEPVWRAERINAINQHFITAFLDLNLKGDTTKAAFLNVSPQSAGEGQWPLAPFENIGGRTASEKETGFWRGFQRRWALGLEMQHGSPGGPR